MDLQFKSIPFEIKAGASDGSEFEGKCSVFFNIDSYGEIVDNKAFDEDLPEFLENGFIGGINHDWDRPIGRPMEGTRPMPDHLHLKASVVDTTHGMDCRKLLKAGVIRKLSIGYRVKGDMMLENEDECMAYWKQKGYKPNADDMARCKMGARVLTRIHLYEASPVSVPANSLATITAVKAAREAAEKAFKESIPAEASDAIPDADTQEQEPQSSERLDKIRCVKSLAEVEDILRDAGMSRTERAALISSVKTLLRDAVSDDAGTPDHPEAESDTAPLLPAETENPPIPTDEPDEDASETPADEDGQSDEEEASIVTRSVDLNEPLALERAIEGRDVSTLLYQRTRKLFDKIDQYPAPR
jgi:HK97 family phage prohead protease